MPDRYAVVGHPIAHSKSPRIHGMFAVQTGQQLVYDAMDVEPGRFAAAVGEFRAGGGRGLNVTVPFKEQAWALAEQRSARAQRAGAVNTLVFDGDGPIFGDNTDGLGLVRDLTVNQGVMLEGRRVLLVGAGGAARGVLEPLLAQRPALLVIANRTPEKAVELARLFCDLGHVEGCGFPVLDGQRFDVVINATAAGLQGEVPPLPTDVAAADGWCYDMMYGSGPTAFVRWARQQGVAHAVDGLGMLVEQAAESFRIWRGVRPLSAPVIAALRAELAAAD
ncbi:MAG: shikimate dehydrogenase [Gammaproteobacteria bacterium]